MALTFLIIVGAAICLRATYAATRPTARPALAGQNTVVGLSDASPETVAGGTKSKARVTWQMKTVDTLRDAEDLLDMLEARGFENRELVILGNSGFAIRWH